MWRETSTYPADRRIKGDPKAATPEFAAQMTESATQIARTSIILIEQELGYQPAEAQEALVQCDRIEQELPTPNTPGQSRHPDIGH